MIPSFSCHFSTRSLFFATGVAVFGLVGCSHVPRVVTEYKIDVQQGNYITQDMIAQLRPGLSKDQVRYILGTPLLTDIFHGERWDYLYRLEKGKTGEVESRKFSVFFTDGVLARVSGDVVAAQLAKEGEGAAGEADNASKQRVVDLGSIPADGSVTPPPLEQKGFFGKLMEKVGL